jgi:type I restriction enzyme S subunit
MRKYQSYKPSGIEWIGEIPERWKLGRLGYYSNVYRGSGYQYLNQVDDEFEKKKEKVVRISDITDFNPIWCEYLEQFENYRIEKSNILMGGTGHYFGKSIFVNEKMEGLIHSYNIIRIVIKIQNPKYIHYYLSSSIIREQMDLSVLGSGQPFIDLQGLKDLIILVPPLHEQEQIVKYLDEKTSIIDKLISTKERKIKLLKEQRTSLINEVITKGLNPNVKMKDSFVEWIGEIPDGWVVIKLKYVGKINSGDGISSELIDNEGTYPVYGGNGIMGYFNNYNFSHKVLSIGRVGEKCGNVHLVSQKSWINDNSLVLDLRNNEMDINYLFNTLTSRNLNSIRNQNTQPLITGTMVKDEFIPKPPLHEQQQIVEYLNKHTKEIDDLVGLEQRKIELLKEYRQSLISEVITGKIKVVE